jgi:hypothetical protein
VSSGLVLHEPLQVRHLLLASLAARRLTRRRVRRAPPATITGEKAVPRARSVRAALRRESHEEEAVRRADTTRILVLAVWCVLLGVSAQARDVVLSGQQIRARGGVDGDLVGEGLTLPDGGVIVSVQCDGDGYWIEGPGGNRVFRTPQAAVNVTLPRGAYRAFPNLKPGQDRATVTIEIRSADATAAAALSGSWTGTFRNTLGDGGSSSLQLRVDGSGASGTVDGDAFQGARWDGSAWRWTYVSKVTQATYTCELRLTGENKARLDYTASGARTWSGAIEYSRAGGGSGETPPGGAAEGLARLAGSWSGTFRNSLGDGGATSLRVRVAGNQASGDVDGDVFQGARWDGSVLRWSYVSQTTKATYACELRLVGENRARMDYQASGTRTWSGTIEYSR